MNEQHLRKVIVAGENESVDFKRELHLDSSSQKAEFVKDIIALANSAPDRGYLIVGVENNGILVGADSLHEERIQQIVHTYIYPNVILKCFELNLDSKLIGVIEVHGVEKPHQVIKEIDRLAVNDVFIRHGSTTAKASPDEMFRMRKKNTETELEVQSLCESAQKHLKLGNMGQAIVAYSKAIDLIPTPEILLARGKTRLKSFELDPSNFLSNYLCIPEDVGSLPLKDFSDALKLQEATLEKEIRLARLELFSICPLDDAYWNEDFAWIEENAKDNEYGKALFFAAARINMLSIYTDEGWDADRLIDFADQAIELGFEDSRIYCLRAKAHFSNQNLGLALKDINLAYNMTRNASRLLKECLRLRSGILKSMGNYELAYDDLLNAKQIKLSNPHDDADWYFLGDIHQLTNDIYQRVAIQWALKSSPHDESLDVYKYILQILILHEGLPKYFSLIGDKTLHKFSQGISIEKEFPLIAPILKKIVGENIWRAAKQGKGYSITIKLE